LVLSVLLAFSCLGLAISCAPKEQKKKPGPAPGPGVFVPDYENTLFTLMGSMKEGKGPHGKVRIWYSDNIKGIVDNEKLEVPEGTVAVKVFDNDGKEGVDGIAVMIKMKKDFDKDANDWEFQMRDAKGRLIMDLPEGTKGMCVKCHAQAANKGGLAGTRMR
jgi:hypothetical protein